ncbi:N-acetylglucosamine-6-phosphate deacetylase [Bifidobacterium reuteri]|uniref:N-acetylglucosamine-6-phosphate deacetylase n=2 Tax=Bifidobacterium reuteri TaxID=983706 RepID=A0A087CSM2_9BIFI|nr:MULTISPECIES: N-acetylglucosamine-6-phosphate deacetylase [Bifidobacterium]KAA8825167.1 N-acetylglucosamine-6-phosphate deacetylase [Bifidobacterium reuteri]KFI86272.1 N-acetylglucosamine-6-phosphate deacetylase [Bifidobacterium reuteri DSM 23975]TPF94629.1 N-acetylglucosamine-6-phosphate deacetylase [Bifidobacterium sp. UTBIF-68]
MSNRTETVTRVTAALEGAPSAFAVRNARKVDARGERSGYWMVADASGVIVATGTDESAFSEACAAAGVSGDGSVLDADGRILVPGYVDIHAHGAWEKSFDDGPEGIDVARTGHAVHGTTRQVLSLITNPVDVICRNIRTVRDKMASGRPDILGCHLEGPFLALARKGAHDPKCLKDPVPEIVDEMLEASGAADGSRGCIRQITIAPELPHGIGAIRQFAAAGVVPAVGHCDADYETAQAGFNAGAGIMTHMFNAMNGLHHRNPGPIPAAVEDPRVTIELINDGFHVQNPMVKLGFGFAPHRIAFVTDAMAATDCPDGAYKLGELDVNVVDGHARLVSNGAIAGSTLLLEGAVSRAVNELGISPVAAVEAATLTPAKAFVFDRPNEVTGAPIGLIAPGFAADINVLDPLTWKTEHVWCAGRRIK